MDASVWYLVGSLIGLWFTTQAIRPTSLPHGWAPIRALVSFASFFAGWLTNELVLWHYAWQAVASAAFIAWGALGSWPGWLAAAITLVQWILMVPIVRSALRTADIVEEALQTALGEEYRDELPDDGSEPWDGIAWRQLAIPFVTRDRRVARERDRVFARVSGRSLKVDVFRPRDTTPDAGPRPVVIYVHGGGWVLGYRDRQGGPLLTELAARGWVGFLPGYRLSPAATYPDQLVDVKRAIAWVRRNADEFGIDADHIVIAGGSAGGHLAALAALTAGRRDLQPGFEDADVRVQACIPLYAPLDPIDRRGAASPEARRFFAEWVLKAEPEEDPDRWSLFCPADQITADAPPFLIVHGERDTLAPVAAARAFADRLASVSAAPVAYAELPGAQHAFDVFRSIRTALTLRGVARFVAVTRARTTSPTHLTSTGGTQATGRG